MSHLYSVHLSSDSLGMVVFCLSVQSNDLHQCLLRFLNMGQVNVYAFFQSKKKPLSSLDLSHFKNSHDIFLLSSSIEFSGLFVFLFLQMDFSVCTQVQSAHCNCPETFNVSLLLVYKENKPNPCQCAVFW